VEIGLPRNADFNGAAQEGVGCFEITVRDGRRMSTARAYLRPAMQRANLRVETGAHATRIQFEGTRATGIEYVRGGAACTARAAREVIVCAGAINSPQLLQLSGIGPADLLRNFVSCAANAASFTQAAWVPPVESSPACTSVLTPIVAMMIILLIIEPVVCIIRVSTISSVPSQRLAFWKVSFSPKPTNISKSPHSRQGARLQPMWTLPICGFQKFDEVPISPIFKYLVPDGRFTPVYSNSFQSPPKLLIAGLNPA
jgi:hypothetical protein